MIYKISRYNKFILLIFVFLNLYNPVSPILTLLVDFLLLIFYSKDGKLHFTKINTLVQFSIVIFIWTIITSIINLTFDLYVIRRYTRVVIATYLISILIMNIKITPKRFINIFSVVLFLHVISIGIQILYPQIISPMAYLFNMHRADILEKDSFRMLGLASSYDTASLIAVMSTMFFLIRYKNENRLMFLIAAFISYFSTIRTSRTGMLVGGIFVTFTLLYLLFKRKKNNILILIISGLIGGYMIIVFIAPILIKTSGINFGNLLVNYNTHIIFDIGHDYGSGSASSLFSEHLKILTYNNNKLKLLFGYATDSSNLKFPSDIGYVETICHIGIIGLIMVLFCYFFIFTLTYKLKLHKNIFQFIYLQTLKEFVLICILLVLLFNYKLLIMYSRGTYDIILISFFSLRAMYSMSIKGEFNKKQYNETSITNLR